MTENTAVTVATDADKNEPLPCECQKFDALDSAQLTEESLANGDYDSWETYCTQDTRNTFAPGHDAKLKSFLIKHELLGHEIRRHEGGVAVSDDAVGHAKRYGFGHMVVAGIVRAQERAAVKAAKKAERDAAKEKKALESGKIKATITPSVTIPDEPECEHDTARPDDLECPECGADMSLVWADQHTDEDKAAYAVPSSSNGTGDDACAGLN
jgi:DNA-directed RNA polymerase subunit M/transcription elongation factor TFIIS